MEPPYLQRPSGEEDKISSTSSTRWLIEVGVREVEGGRQENLEFH